MKAPPNRLYRKTRHQIAAILAAAGLVAALPNVKLVAKESAKPASETLDHAWQDAATFLANDANKIFRTTKETPLNERERALGNAVTLLNIQPRTVGNLEQARKEFEKLAASGEKDTPAIFANYFLARICERYESPAKLDEAKKRYRELLETSAGNAVAEYGASALVMMSLYADITPAEREARFAELEQLKPLLKTPSGRRDYHLSMGNAYIDFEASPAKAIEHLLAADAETISRWQVESATWVSIGELARIEGRLDLATTYYGKFLAKYKRDNRHYTIQKRLEALSSAQ